MIVIGIIIQSVLKVLSYGRKAVSFSGSRASLSPKYGFRHLAYFMALDATMNFPTNPSSCRFRSGVASYGHCFYSGALSHYQCLCACVVGRVVSIPTDGERIFRINFS